MLSLAAQWLTQLLHVLQTALGEAVRQEKTVEKDQGVVALAKKAEDLYKQQQEIIKKADKRYTSICVSTTHSAVAQAALSDVLLSLLLNKMGEALINDHANPGPATSSLLVRNIC